MAKVSTTIQLVDKISDTLRKSANRANELADKLDNINKAAKDVTNNSSKMSKVLDKASNAANKLDNKLSGVCSGAAKLGKISLKGLAIGVTAVSAAATAAVGGMYKLAEKTSDLGEAQNVVSAVYEQQKGYEYLGAEVNNWAKTLVASHGIAAQSATDYVGQLASMTTGMGVNAEEATEMSKNMVKMVGDWASFYNLDHEEAFTKIKAGLSGESEPLKSLGIIMTENSLSAYALSEGITKAYKDMTEAEKATLRYNFMMDKTQATVGDFADTLDDSLANQMRYFNTLVGEIGTNMGSNFTGPVMDAFKVLNDFANRLNTIFADGWQDGDMEKITALFTEFANKAANGIAQALPTIINVVSTIINSIGSAVVTMLPTILPQLTDGVIQIINGIKTVLINNAGAIVSAATEIGAQILKALYEVFTGEQMSVDAFNNIKESLTDIMELVKNLGGFVAKHFGTIAKVTLTIVAAVKAFTIAVKALTAAEKAYTVVKKIQEKLNKKSLKSIIAEKVATIASTAATTATTAATKAATVAQLAFNAALKLSPVMLAVTAVGALGVGVYALGKYIMSAGDKSEELNARISENAKNIFDFKAALDSCQPSITDYSNLLSPQGMSMGDIEDKIATTESAITEIISKAMADNRALRDQEIQDIMEYQAQLRTLEDQKLAIYQGQQEGLLSKVEILASSGNLTPQEMAQITTDAMDIYENTTAAIAANRASADRAAKAVYDASSKSAEDKAIYDNAILQNLELAKQENQSAVEAKNATLDALAQYAYDKANEDNLLFSLSSAASMVQNGNDPNGNFAVRLHEGLDKFTGEAADYAGAILTIAATIRQNGGELTSTIDSMQQEITGIFDELPAKSEEGGRNILKGMMGGLSDDMGVIDTAETTCNDIINKYNETFEINSPSRVTYRIGGYLIEGLINGLNAKKASLFAMVNSIANTITTTLNEALEVGSPSRVAYRIGQWFDMGLINGLMSMRKDIALASGDISTAVVADEDRLSYMQNGSESSTNGSKGINISVNMPVNINSNGSEADAKRIIERLEEALEEALYSSAEGVY